MRPLHFWRGRGQFAVSYKGTGLANLNSRPPLTCQARKLAAQFTICLAALVAANTASAQASLEPLDTCFLEAPEDGPSLVQECSYVVLPENPEQAYGAEVRLGFLRLPAIVGRGPSHGGQPLRVPGCGGGSGILEALGAKVVRLRWPNVLLPEARLNQKERETS